MAQPGDPVDAAGYYPDGTKAYPNGGDPGRKNDGTPFTPQEIAAAEAEHQQKFGLPVGTPLAPTGWAPVSTDGPNVGNTQGNAPQQQNGYHPPTLNTTTWAPDTSAADAKAATDANNARINNAYEYGGEPGGAAASSNYFNGLAIGDQQRKGEVIDYTNANADRGNNLGARGQQETIANLIAARAQGTVPTIASLQAAQDAQKLAAQQSSAAASARGPAALALAQQGAAANTAAGESTISNTAQINSANERRSDETAAEGAYTGIRQGDQTLQGQDAGQSITQAQINAAQRAQNDAASQANYGNAIGINEFQSGAQQNRVGAEHGLYFNQQNLTQQQHDSGRNDLGTALQIGGAVAAGVGTVATVGSLFGSSKGGGQPINGAGGSTNGGSAGAPGALPPGDATYDPSTGRTIVNDGNGGWSLNSNTQPIQPGGSFGMGGPAASFSAPATNPSSLANVGSSVAKAAPAPTIASLGAPQGSGSVTTSAGGAPPGYATPKPHPLEGTGALNIAGTPAPSAPKPPTLATATNPRNAAFTSDVDTKSAISSEGMHPLERGGSRVDAFLDGIHPLSYTYKDPSQEPRSQSTGGRYLGISAQALEAVPEVGHQMVSDGPRGKQIEVNPTLSAAMAGIARLNERLKGVESTGAQHHVSQERSNYFQDQQLKQRQHESGREDLRMGAGMAGAGAQAVGGAMVSDMTAKTQVEHEGARPVAVVARPAGPAPHPLEGYGRAAVELAHQAPVPGAVPGMLDPAKALMGAGQAANMAAEGYERGYERAKPHILEAKHRVEGVIDEAALRARNAARAVAGQPQVAQAPTIANLGGR